MTILKANESRQLIRYNGVAQGSVVFVVAGWVVVGVGGTVGVVVVGNSVVDVVVVVGVSIVVVEYWAKLNVIILIAIFELLLENILD